MKKLILLFMPILMILSLIVYPFAYHSSSEMVTITVVDKEKTISNKQSKYLIFGEDEVFENTDSYIFWKFDSSDLYRDLEKGESYRVKVSGWRVPFLSMYRNIVEIK